MPMTLLEMLYQQYGTNEPILLSEITFEDYSRPWIMKQLQLLCESGDLCKYEKEYIMFLQTPSLEKAY